MRHTRDLPGRVNSPPPPFSDPSLENAEGYEWLFGWTPEARKHKTVSRSEVVKAIALVNEQIELSGRKKARNRTRNERRHKKKAENAAAASGADPARGGSCVRICACAR